MASRKRKIKKLVSQLHLWLGLTSGSIVFIVALSGAFFVFHDEIKDTLYSWRIIENAGTSFIKPSTLFEENSRRFPEANASMVMYQGKNRPAFLNTSKNGVFYRDYYNPYSGKYLHREKVGSGFFDVVEDIHRHLLLPEKIGEQIVGISTLIFVLLLVTGLILWWPKKRKNLKQRLKIKWNARWRRINYDWHSVTGFYTTGLALMIALTGLSFSYEWMHAAFYEIGNFGSHPPGDKVISKLKNMDGEEVVPNLEDRALRLTLKKFPDNEMFFVWKRGPHSPMVTGTYPQALSFDHQSNLYFHPKTGELLQQQTYSKKSSGLKLQEMTYGLHTGQFFGIFGKIILFITSLLVAALPVSGFLLWWGRNKKTQKKKMMKMDTYLT